MSEYGMHDIRRVMKRDSCTREQAIEKLEAEVAGKESDATLRRRFVEIIRIPHDAWWRVTPSPGARRAGQVGKAVANVGLRHAGGYELVLKFQDGKLDSFAPNNLSPGTPWESAVATAPTEDSNARYELDVLGYLQAAQVCFGKWDPLKPPSFSKALKERAELEVARAKVAAYPAWIAYRKDPADDQDVYKVLEFCACEMVRLDEARGSEVPP